MVNIVTPQKYNQLTWQQRKVLRETYATHQNNLCWHCNRPLNELQPIPEFIDKSLFPKKFFDYPIHLHHNHKTDLTIGTVHAVCNAILWEFHNE